MANLDLHDLRMQEFPHYVRLALNKLEMCVQSHQTPQIVILQRRLIEEFIFCSHDNSKPNNSTIKILNLSVNELMVVRIIISHLTSVTNAPLRNALLVVLFHPASAESSQNPYNKKVPSNSYANPPINPFLKNFTSDQYAANQNLGPAYNLTTEGGSQYNSKNICDLKVSHRINILSSLCSLALAAKNKKVLESIAVWMQQICSLSGWSSQVGKRLASEYCSTSYQISTTSKHPFDDLPAITPLFTTNIITCWAQIYARLGTVTGGQAEGGSSVPMGACRRPPLALLHLIVLWLKNSSPSVLLSPLTAHPSLTSLASVAGAITPPPFITTPIAPLLRWCVEAPFFLRAAVEAAHRTKCFGNKSVSSDDTFDKRSCCSECSVMFEKERSLYHDLHLCLLKCLNDVPHQLPLPAQRQVVCSEQIITIVEGLIKLLEPSSTVPLVGSFRKPEHQSVELPLEEKMVSVNRLAQVILVATHTDCLFGNTPELTNSLRKIPMLNRLVKMLLTPRPHSQHS